MKHERVKRPDHGQLKLGEAWVIGVEIVGRKSAISRMDTNR